MDALLALQSSLHCLAVFCSAIADWDKASSPTTAAHTAKVGFITHISEKFRRTAMARSRGAGAKETAALAAAMWSAAPDRQHLIVLCSFAFCQEQRANCAGKKGRRRGSPPSRSNCQPRSARAPSMRGERRGIGLHRRLGAHRGFGRLSLLLVPFDRLGLARERARQHLVHARDRNDVEALFDALADLDEVLGVLFRDQHRLHAAARGREQLLL